MHLAEVTSAQRCSSAPFENQHLQVSWVVETGCRFSIECWVYTIEYKTRRTNPWETAENRLRNVEITNECYSADLADLVVNGWSIHDCSAEITTEIRNYSWKISEWQASSIACIPNWIDQEYWHFTWERNWMSTEARIAPSFGGDSCADLETYGSCNPVHLYEKVKRIGGEDCIRDRICLAKFWTNIEYVRLTTRFSE